MKITKYPDGTSYTEADTQLIGNITYEFTHKINSYEDLWHLHQRVDAFWNLNKQKPTVLIPNLIDAQADRRFGVGQSSGLKLVCQFLNEMKANFKIFHPHNPEVVEALIDNVEIIDNSKFIKEILLDLNIEKTNEKGFGFKGNNLILLSSDAGSFKPLMKLCDKINWQGETFSASKSRKHENGKSTLIQTIDRNMDFNGKDILIIDDICIYGGTFKGLAKMLKEPRMNVGKLYLAVSHMTVQNLGEDSVTNYFDKVFTTNSKYDSYWSKDYWTGEGDSDQPPNLEIIKMF